MLLCVQAVYVVVGFLHLFWAVLLDSDESSIFFFFSSSLVDRTVNVELLFLPRLIPRNRRGGVLFRFYTRRALNFASFCCKPSAISPSAARIARARRGGSIHAVGPPIGVGVETLILA